MIQIWVVIVFKKRIRLHGKGKSGSARTIICYQHENRAIFIHGFLKNEKSNLTPKELNAFKELAKILLGLSREALNIAIKNGDLMEDNYEKFHSQIYNQHCRRFK